jgi:hypothetical protein
MNKITKLAIPISIIISCLFLGYSFVYVQEKKQESIEKQVELKIKQENELIEKQEKAEKLKNSLYNLCVSSANSKYWKYMRINGTERADGTIWAINSYWDRAEKVKQQDINNCAIKYK